MHRTADRRLAATLIGQYDLARWLDEGYARTGDPEWLRFDQQRSEIHEELRLDAEGVDSLYSGLRQLREHHRGTASTPVRVLPVRARTGQRRESHRGRPGHRRVRSTRAGPSSDDGPGEPPPPAPRRRVVVDDHYVVVAVVAT